MKILVLSDSHDNIVRLNHVMGFGQAQGFDAVIHCGDWNTPLAVSEISKSPIKLYGVLGNADVDKKMEQLLFGICEEFNPDFLELNLDNKKIGICHYPTGLDTPALSQEYDILFFGHTHIAKNQKYKKTQIVNPGALHRTNSPSFAVYDTENDQVEIIDVMV